jgi:hypothetical protein
MMDSAVQIAVLEVASFLGLKMIQKLGIQLMSIVDAKNVIMPFQSHQITKISNLLIDLN